MMMSLMSQEIRALGMNYINPSSFCSITKNTGIIDRRSLCSLNIKSSQPDDYVLSVVFVEASLTSQGVPHSA